jgi:hypothetical protein
MDAPHLARHSACFFPISSIGFGLAKSLPNRKCLQLPPKFGEDDGTTFPICQKSTAETNGKVRDLL